MTTEQALMCTWSASSRWPRIFASPPIVQCLPMRALPATALHSRPSRCARRCARCARCGSGCRASRRLSITVSSSAPRSIVQFAPISTSLPMRTRPSCSIFTQRPPSGAKPKPSAPMTTAAVHDAALAQFATRTNLHLRRDAAAGAHPGIRLRSPCARRSPRRRRSDAPASMTANGADADGRSPRPAPGATRRRWRARPAASAARSARQPPLAEAGVVQIGLRGDDQRSLQRRFLGEQRAARSARRRGWLCIASRCLSPVTKLMCASPADARLARPETGRSDGPISSPPSCSTI